MFCEAEAMTKLRHPLPEQLDWLTCRIEQLIGPAAFLVRTEEDRNTKAGGLKTIAPVGGTFISGCPDVPLGAPWALSDWAGSNAYRRTPYEGEAFIAQLNLEDIPPDVLTHLPKVPRVGVVWVTADLDSDSDGWEGRAYFSPQCAKDTTWRARETHRPETLPLAMNYVLADTLPYASEKTLPEIAWDWQGQCKDFDDWRDKYYGRKTAEIQLGGWIHLVQGDCDEERETLVASFGHLHFGDCGEVYLHYSVERGFFVRLYTN